MIDHLRMLGQYPSDSGPGAPEPPSVPDIKPAPANKVEARKLRRDIFEGIMCCFSWFVADMTDVGIRG
jgi:hypothetical protein